MGVARKLVEIAGNAQKIYESGFKDGAEANWDVFWDLFQDFGIRTKYKRAFSLGWHNETFLPKYKIVPQGEICADYMFYETNIETVDDTKVDFSKVENFNNVFEFSQCTSISMDARSAKSMFKTFYNANFLTSLTIHNLQEDCTFEDAFTGSICLSDLYLTGSIGQDINLSTCSILTRESILNFVDSLSINAEGKTAKLSLHAVAKAFETSHEKRDGDTTKEWLDIVATRPNWTITLVKGFNLDNWS